MKTFFVVLAVLVASVQSAPGDHDHSEALLKIEDKCVKETGVDLAILTNAEKGIFPDGVDLKCFPKCAFLAAGFMRLDGTMDVEEMKAHAMEKEASGKSLPIVEKCAQLKGADACQTADVVYRCYWEEVTKAGIY